MAVTGDRKPEFMRVQYAFAGHLRDPEGHPPPSGIEQRRLAIYRELVYNNVESFLRNGFPVLYRLLDDALWQRLVRSFLRDHRSHSPYFLEIGREFMAFLEQRRDLLAASPPFTLELCHYEWVELALDIDEREIPDDEIAVIDPLDTSFSLSPLAWLLEYRFPVHRIGPDFRPSEPGVRPTCLIVYRDRADRVRFLEVSPLVQGLARLFSQQRVRAADAIAALADASGYPDPEKLLEAGRTAVAQLHERSILVSEGGE